MSGYDTTETMDQAVRTGEVRNVLTKEEIQHLAVEGGQSAETLMNVVALIAKRFRTDVCSAYSSSRIAPISFWPQPSGCAANVLEICAWQSMRD